MDEKEKKKPEEVGTPEEKPKEENPAEKPEDAPVDKPEDEKKPADKPEGEGAKDEPKADEPPKDDKPAETPAPAPDDKDSEILRLKTQIAAMQLCVKPDCMEDVVAIAESYVKNGTAADINASLSSVVKKYTDMKAEGGKSDSKKQAGGFKVGADTDKKNEETDSKISAAFGIKKKK